MKLNSLSANLKNFLNKRVIFRCDGGNVPEIGTGHIYRCLTIAKFLETKKIKKKNILFISKKKNNFSKGFNLIKSAGFKVYSPESNIKLEKKIEINTLSLFSSELLIIDRLDKIKKRELIKLKKKHKKIVLIDSMSRYIKDSDLYLNPHIKNKYTNKNFGLKYLILPGDKIKKTKKKEKKIFLYFGGYDNKNILKKTINILSKINFNLKICIEKKHEKFCKDFNNLNFIFLNKKNFFLHLKNSNFAIISGGLILYCALKYNVPNISIPQYNHQELNILKIKKLNGTVMLHASKLKQKLENILKKFNNKSYINNYIKHIKLNFSKKINNNALLMILKLYDKKNI